MDEQRAAKSLDRSPPEARRMTEDRKIVALTGSEGGTMGREETERKTAEGIHE
jgi:hypothetical protein